MPQAERGLTGRQENEVFSKFCMGSRKVKEGRKDRVRGRGEETKIIKNVKCTGINENTIHLFKNNNKVLKHKSGSGLEEQFSGERLWFR